MTFSRSGRTRHTLVLGCLALLLAALGACSNEGADSEPTVVEATGSEAEAEGEGDEGQQTEAVEDGDAQTQSDADSETQDRSVSVAADDTILISGDQASFVMPSGNIQCVMRTGSVVCQISQKGSEPDQSDLSEAVLGDCSTSTADALTLLDDDVAAWTCTSETIRGQASIDLGGWWVADGVGDTEDIEGTDLAVLNYGQAMQLGSILCSSESTGISCRDTASSAGFTLARESYTTS
ncbi:hypothetical protein BH23ACT6_BH23ACT6_11120 [soil metagenome]